MVVQQLGGTCGDIISLDGHKLRSTGIVCGSSFSTVPLHLASYRFTQLPTSQVRVSVLAVIFLLVLRSCLWLLASGHSLSLLLSTVGGAPRHTESVTSFYLS
jgi:hypothetical protein